jgi:glycosyltransferase involved in cell wall biosynthesis
LELVGNHGHAASRQLVEMGINPALVVPWDWPQVDPASHPKRMPGNTPPHLLYVGAISEEKGLLDALRGVELFLDRGGECVFNIIGSDKHGLLARWLGQGRYASCIVAHGQQPRAFVQKMMSTSDLVIVPSRHAYSEGMPKAIFDALCARTPLVVSDHPIFMANLTNRESAMIFPEGQADAIADAVDAALRPEHYESLSEGGLNAWNRMQINTKWLDLVEAWLTGNDDWWHSRSYCSLLRAA